MQKLSDHDIKVPNVLWYESSDDIFGTSFYVMEMAKGDAPSDNPPFHPSASNIAQNNPDKKTGEPHFW